MKVNLNRSIEDLAAEVRSGSLKATDLVNTCLDRIKETEDFHTVLEVNPEALKRAAEIDKNPKGRLAGIPFIAKDNFLTAGTHTTAASRILEPFKAPYQATVIEKLEAEGAILVAKANLDAFAHGSSTENSDFGPTKNPHDPAMVPGGSSGGSAAAVALGQCLFALGTDTGSSVRLPASFCGVVGLKPTYGLVSRYGVIAMGSSFDVIGPIARTVEDTALVLDVMAGKDIHDATTIERDENYEVSNTSNLKGLKIGLIKEYMGEGVDPEVKKDLLDRVEQFRELGAEISEVSIPSVDLGLACYYILVPAEVSSNLARYDGVKYGHSAAEAKNLAETYDLSRDQGFGTEAKRRILIGTYVLSSGYYDAYYKQAQKVRTMVVNEFERAFKRFDLLIAPNAPTTAFPLGQKAHDPLAMYLCDIMQVAVNLVGIPAISIPSSLDSNRLPIGLQLMAPQKAEIRLLSAASAMEKLMKKKA